MGIDVATWRARIGLNNYRQSRYACRSLPVHWRAARWGVGEVMNSTPLLLQGCMAVVSLSLILGYTFPGRLTGRCGCGKVCRPKLRGDSAPSTEVRGVVHTGTIGVCLLLRVCAVVLALLLMAGDVERNPGPTGSDQVEKVLPTVDNTPLGEDDHFDILTEMMPVANSWKAIGRGLRIDSGRLEAIYESNPKNPKECLSEMLTYWLRRSYNVERFGEPTWRALVKVVAHPAAGDNCALALNIAEQHSVVSAAAPQTTKQTPFRNQGDSGAGKPTFTSEGASVSPGPGSSTQSKETQKTLEAYSHSVIMSDKEAQTIVDQALKSGSLDQRNAVAVVVGTAGSGKTWLISRLFRLKPPDSYTSTGVAEKAFRGLIRHVATMNSWELLSQDKILEALAPFIQAGLPEADIASLAKIFIEEEAPEPTNTLSSEALPCFQSTAIPDALPVPSPFHSITTIPHVAHPVQEKSLASETMISLLQTVKGSKKALIMELLHMIDTGGQPEFMEIMPSLIHNSNLTVLVLNLAQSLDECPHFTFHENGTTFTRPLPSVLTNKQVICQLAQTLQAKRPSHKGSSCSKVIVIGTHRDCVKGKLSETLAAVNKELKSIFLPTMEDELITYCSRDEIVFPVNLLDPDECDKKVLEVVRQRIVSAGIGEQTKIPISFFMFEQDVIEYAEQKRGKDRKVMILSFDECMQVGTRLKMSHEVVQAALIYFHCHNVFLYFQHILPHLVFLAPQVPLDFVNAIVAFSYKVKCGVLLGLEAKYERFCNEGIVTEEMLCDKSLSDNFIPGIYEPQDAISLFLHIYTIAPLSNEEPIAKNQPGQKLREKREYLMISMLDDKHEKDFQECLLSPSRVAPLFVHFSSGCVPTGCFGNTISCLISTYKWKVCQTEQGKPACLAHNIVTLHDPKLPVTITMVNYTRHLEIHINTNSIEEEHFNEICLGIRKVCFAAMKMIFRVMRFEDIQVQPAFHCPCKCKPSHAATVCHFLFGGSYTICTKTGISVGGLQKEQQVWFEDEEKVQRPTLPQLLLFNTRSGSFNVLEQIGIHYRKLGVLLLDDDTGAVTQAIVKQYHYDATDINMEILQRWIQGKGKLPVDWATLIKVLKDIGLPELARKMEQTLK